MIPVQIVDVRRREMTHESGAPIFTIQIVLYDEAGRRALVVWVDEMESGAAANQLFNPNASRSASPPFLLRMLQAVEASVDHVEISALRDGGFDAVVTLSKDGTLRQVDARPADALELAFFADIPVFASEDVLNAAGRTIPPGTNPIRKGLAALRAEQPAAHPDAQPAPGPQPDKTPLKPGQEHLIEDVLAEVFGVFGPQG